jgi:hypothetical protein
MLLIYLFSLVEYPDRLRKECRNSLVEEGLEDNDLVTRLNETHESTKHSC